MPVPEVRSKLWAISLVACSILICGGAFFLSNCGNSNSGSGVGAVAVSISDPPSCMPPNGDFAHVYVSIRSVQAHISATANDNSPGWQELAPQLNTAPVQVDLLSKPATGCLLAQLGNTTSLPVGSYQQIRLLLVSNDAGNNPVPAADNCGSAGWNCVVLSDGSIHMIDLSSQSNTGLKIPPGQIVGGPIDVTPGQSVDVNIDFNTCASLILEGNGDFRLKPTLTAGQVSANNTGISGRIVDSTTGQPIPNGLVQVALEIQTNSGVDTIFMQAATDSNGNFNFCPLPANTKFDVVAAGLNPTTGVAYHATVLEGVPAGTAVGSIPVTPETSSPAGPATIQGFVSVLTSTNAPGSADVSVSALQGIQNGALLVTIPLQTNSMADLTLNSAATCPSGSPLNANCSQYSLVVPASNPVVGSFSSNISYAAPASGSVLYTVSAQASVPLSGNSPDCAPPSLTTNQNASGQPLAVTSGATGTAKEINFSGCM